jgi:hypothetical protein
MLSQSLFFDLLEFDLKPLLADGAASLPLELECSRHLFSMTQVSLRNPPIPLCGVNQIRGLAYKD